MSVEIHNRPLKYPLAVVGLVLIAFLLRVGLNSLIETLMDGSTSWLPTFGTTGQTATVYILAVNLFTFVLLPAGIFWLGKQYGQYS